MSSNTEVMPPDGTAPELQDGEPRTPVGTDFKAVALGAGANLEALPAYFTDPLLGTGNMPGLAISAFNNRALRQATFIASSLCLWISDQEQVYVPDDGSQPNWIALWQNALSAFVAALIPPGPNLGAYLPLAGGTMVGNINFQTGISTVLANNTWYYGRDTGNQARGLILKSNNNDIYINDGSSPRVTIQGVPVANNNFAWSGRDTSGNVRSLIGLLSDNQIHIGSGATGELYFDVTGSVHHAGNIILANNHYIYGNDTGATPRILIGTNTSNEALISYGTLGATHLYAGSGYAIYFHATTYALGQFQVNGYTYINGGGRAYIPGGNDPFQVAADNGFYARTHFVSFGTRDWSCGCLNNGPFAIADESAGRFCWEIDLNGNITSFGSQTINVNLYVAGGETINNGLTVYNNLNVASGNVWMAGSIVQLGNLWMSGQIFLGSQPGIYDAGNGWLFFNGWFNIGGAIQVNNNIQTLANLYCSGNTYIGNQMSSNTVVTNYIQDNGNINIGGGCYANYFYDYGQCDIRGRINCWSDVYVVGGQVDAWIYNGAHALVAHIPEYQRSYLIRLGAGTADYGGWYMAGAFFVSEATAWPPTAGMLDWLLVISGGIVVGRNGNAWKQGGGFWADASERRIKKDIEDLRPDDALEVVKKLRPRKFRFNGSDDHIDDGKFYYGFIAEEVEEVLPEVVFVPADPETGETDKYNPSKMKSVDATAAFYTLIQAVKLLTEKVERLERTAHA